MPSSLPKYWPTAISPVLFAGLSIGLFAWQPRSSVLQAVLLLAAAGAGLITQRSYQKAAVNARRQNNAGFQAFLESLAHCTIVLDAEGRITYISPGAHRYGLDAGKILGQPWRNVVLPFNLPRFEALFASIGVDQTDAAGPTVLELELERGDRRFCDVAVFRLRNESGLQTVVLFHDVTERQVVRDSMNEIDRMAAVAHLSAGVAHNFNNILAGIMLNAGLLADAEGEERLLLSERVIASAERGAALCRNLVTFAQGEAPALGQVQIQPLLSDLVLLFETEARRHAVAITWDADPSLTVYGDRSHIRQILLNLLFNAREAVGMKGRISVSASLHEGKVQITVSNDGPPLPPTHLPLIFLPFFTTKDDDPLGHGMGLAVCLSLARGMGGTITVSSEPGAETAFSLVLPAATAD